MAGIELEIEAIELDIPNIVRRLKPKDIVFIEIALIAKAIINLLPDSL